MVDALILRKSLIVKQFPFLLIANMLPAAVPSSAPPPKYEDLEPSKTLQAPAYEDVQANPCLPTKADLTIPDEVFNSATKTQVGR